MKFIALASLSALAAAAAGLMSAGSSPEGCAESCVLDAPSLEIGTYVEFRSVSLWAGACHYNAEVDHQGTTALLGMTFAGGAQPIDAMLAIESPRNIREGAARRSELWVDASASDAEFDAIRELLVEAGELLAVHRAEVSIETDGEHFTLAVPGIASASVVLMPDRSCCTMPEQRWYEPLLVPAGAPVGQVEDCWFGGSERLEGWVYEGANSAFGVAPRLD